MKLDSMNKKNQYKFLYDVLGNSIIVENLINEDCSENNQKGIKKMSHNTFKCTRNSGQ